MAFQVGLAPVRSDRNGPGSHFVCEEHKKQLKQTWRCDHDPENPHYVESPARGWDYGDQLVVLADDVLKEIESETDTSVSLTHVVDSMDPIWFDQAYLLWPVDDSPSGGPYDLLARVLQDTGRVLLGTVKLWKKTRLVAVRWSGATATLVMHFCAFDEQMRWKDVASVATGITVRPAPDKAMLALVKQFFGVLESGVPELRDEYAERLAKAVETAATGGVFESTPKPAPRAPAELDRMMDALREEVKRHSKPKKSGKRVKS
jgi:non-homologous end joining protein Ku